MYIIIIGGGKVGYYLAKKLIKAEHEVLLIEKDKKKCLVIADELGEIVYQGDGCEIKTMRETGFERADYIVAVTGDDEDNLVVCQMAKQKFKVPHTIARVNNPKNEEIFKKLGIDETVSSTAIIYNLIEQEVEVPDTEITPLLSLREGKVSVLELTIAKNAKVVGKKVSEIQLGNDCVLATLVRKENSQEQIIFPRGNTILLPNDILVVVTNPQKEAKLQEMFLSPENK